MNKWVYSFGSGSSDGISKKIVKKVDKKIPLLQKFVIISITINKIILRN